MSLARTTECAVTVSNIIPFCFHSQVMLLRDSIWALLSAVSLQNRLVCTWGYWTLTQQLLDCRAFLFLDVRNKMWKKKVTRSRQDSSSNRDQENFYVMCCWFIEMRSTCAGSKGIVQGQKNPVTGGGGGAFEGQWREKKTRRPRQSYIRLRGCFWGVLVAVHLTCVTVFLLYFLAGMDHDSISVGWWIIYQRSLLVDTQTAPLLHRSKDRQETMRHV